MLDLATSFCKDFIASKVTQNAAASDATVTEMVGSLSEVGKNREAIEVMVRKMPVEDGISFASESIKISPYPVTEEDQAVLDIVDKWMEDPEAIDQEQLDLLNKNLENVSFSSPASPLGQAVNSAATGDVASAQNFTSNSILLSAAPPEELEKTSAEMPVNNLAELEVPDMELVEKIELASMEAPEIPEFPELPDMPEAPGLPEIPELALEVPEVPEIPEVPEDLLDPEMLAEYQDSLKPFVDLGLELGESLPGWA
ncbi:MAG: hypothetical protein NE330_16685 [Lentisphaeraceae bacterium]|nr:hypothetical protein [Lentisphaeraceae bacterium]